MSIDDSIQELRRSYQNLLESLTRLQGDVATNSLALRNFATLPYGTILPFFGQLRDLDGTDWVACTEEGHARDSRVPNLESRFIMGATATAMGTWGGRERLEAAGAHDHGGVTGGLGYTPGEINWDPGPGRQAQYSHLHGIASVGAHDHGAGGDLRPPFFTTCFIIRLKAG